MYKRQVEEGVPVVTTGAGNPGKYIPAWKAAGIKVIPVVAAAVLAKHLEPLGIDAVIAEGTESGGHVGEMATMALVPQVVDAVNEMCIRDSVMAEYRGLNSSEELPCGVSKCEGNGELKKAFSDKMCIRDRLFVD